MKQLSRFKVIVFALLFFAPIPAFAIGEQLEEMISFIYRMVSSYLIPIAFALALLFFIWGLAIFIKNSGSEDAHKEGRDKMIWGVLALFVIVAVWGLVRFLGNVFGIRNTGPFAPPGIPGATTNPPRTNSTSGGYNIDNYPN